jgi:hypothetical protein
LELLGRLELAFYQGRAIIMYERKKGFVIQKGETVTLEESVTYDIDQKVVSTNGIMTVYRLDGRLEKTEYNVGSDGKITQRKDNV